MIAPEVLDALLKAGATAEMIVAAMKADRAVDDALAALEREAGDARKALRREANADRQRRWRESNASSRVTGVTNGDSALVTDTPPILDKESVPQTPFKEINPTPDTETRARKADPFPCPEGVEAQHWRDFLGNRRTRRLTNTPTAYDGILSRIAELSDDEWPPGKLVQFAAGKGWGSINDPRESEHRNGNGRLVQREAGTPGIGRTEAAALDAKARLRAALEHGGDQRPG